MKTSQVQEAEDRTVVHLNVVVVSSQSMQPVEELQVPAVDSPGKTANNKQTNPAARATLRFRPIKSPSAKPALA